MSSLKLSTLVVLMFLLEKSHAVEESPDAEFLEWLGETAEVEELGLELDELLLVLQQEKSDSDEEKSQ